MTRTLVALTLFLATVSAADAQTGQRSQANSPWTIPQTSKTPDKKSPKQPCPRYGEGFYQVPGTDTCVRFNGDVRSDFSTGSR